MKAKLIKVGDHYDLYYRDEVENLIIGFASTDGTFERKLSVKNCQEIEHGYDLDEYIAFEIQAYIAEKHNQDRCVGFMDGYEIGFQKALKLMVNKNFSEEDMNKAFRLGHSLQTDINLKKKEYKPSGQFFEEFIQSLQQNEWDVEIEMDILNEYNQPKLDSDGYLILKRES